MSIEAMRQARNAFVWNLNTDLDNIPACERWAKMLRKNIDALDEAIAEAENVMWIGLTDDEIDAIYEQHHNQYGECETPNFGYERAIEAKLKEKNNG